MFKSPFDIGFKCIVPMPVSTPAFCQVKISRKNDDGTKIPVFSTLRKQALCILPSYFAHTVCILLIFMVTLVFSHSIYHIHPPSSTWISSVFTRNITEIHRLICHFSAEFSQFATFE